MRAVLSRHQELGSAPARTWRGSAPTHGFGGHCRSATVSLTTCSTPAASKGIQRSRSAAAASFDRNSIRDQRVIRGRSRYALPRPQRYRPRGHTGPGRCPPPAAAPSRDKSTATTIPLRPGGQPACPHRARRPLHHYARPPRRTYGPSSARPIRLRSRPLRLRGRAAKRRAERNPPLLDSGNSAHGPADTPTARTGGTSCPRTLVQRVLSRPLTARHSSHKYGPA
jgi:hypothetical protein